MLSERAHLIGLILLGISMGVLATLLSIYIESRVNVILAMANAFIPLFVVTHWLADYLGDYLSRKK
jgi:ABC-type transport system involved in multi-copper enzyme maturation permease subunit